MNKHIKSCLRDCLKSRFVGFVGLSLYLGFLFYRMFFYAYGSFYRTRAPLLQYNLIPFKTLTDFLVNRSTQSLEVLVYNLMGNIIVFMPLGFLICLTFYKRNTLVKTAGYSCLIILAAETLQLVTRLGVFDLDDVILNLIGCCMGYWAYGLLTRGFHGLRKI